MSFSTDEISFPGLNNNGAKSYNRSRAFTGDSKQSDNSDSTKSSLYHHVARPLPIWVLDKRYRQNRGMSDESNDVSLDTRDTSRVTTDSRDQRGEASINSKRSRWNTLIWSTSRFDYDSTGYIDEKALEEQGDLSGEWIGIKQQDNRPSAKKRQKQEDIHPISTARYFVSSESRQVWKPRLNFILLNNPYVPLTLRAIIFILSTVALGLAGSVYVHSINASPDPITQQPSTIMAVTVQTTALVYLVYITYDEYSGQPIGLREPKAKMRLIMLDLLFIIFSSANLSLAFNTVYDATWICHVGDSDSLAQHLALPFNAAICSRQKALASFLFMVLVMWVATFTISIFRLVERVTS